MHSNRIYIFTVCVIMFTLLTVLYKVVSFNPQPPQVFVVDLHDKIEKRVLPAKRLTHDQLPRHAKREIECLAKNIYHEAAFEPKIGWVAVGAVTMNRVLSGKFPSTVCGVVYQNNGRTYQFSWVGMKKKLNKINQDIYEEIIHLATAIYLGYTPTMDDPTGGALFYHADYVNPNWKLRKTEKIGRHIFYTYNQTQ